MENVQSFILYTTANGDVKINVLLHNESLWLTQKTIAELFGVDRSVITKHLGNIYETNELQKSIN